MSRKRSPKPPVTPASQPTDVRRVFAVIMVALGTVLVVAVLGAIVSGIQRYRSWTKVDGRILEYETVTTSSEGEQRVVHFRRYAYRVGSRVVLAQGPDLRQGFGPEVSSPPAGTNVRLAYDPNQPRHATTLRDAFTPTGMSSRLLSGLVLLGLGIAGLRVFRAAGGIKETSVRAG